MSAILRSLRLRFRCLFFSSVLMPKIWAWAVFNSAIADGCGLTVETHRPLVKVIGLFPKLAIIILISCRCSMW